MCIQRPYGLDSLECYCECAHHPFEVLLGVIISQHLSVSLLRVGANNTPSSASLEVLFLSSLFLPFSPSLSLSLSLSQSHTLSPNLPSRNLSLSRPFQFSSSALPHFSTSASLSLKISSWPSSSLHLPLALPHSLFPASFCSL